MATEWQFRTRIIKLGESGDGRAFDEQHLREAAEPNEPGEDWYEIFGVFPLGRDTYRLMMRRPKPPRS